jgi:quercetin dioxygenase-like cupin family protein
MRDGTQCMQVFHVLEGDALRIKSTPYGHVGSLYSDERIEAVWVRKQDEEIDPDWFSQPMVDLILVMQGQLKVEFEGDQEDQLLNQGDVLILPGNTRCKAYRWPRESEEEAIFLAIYPVASE